VAEEDDFSLWGVEFDWMLFELLLDVELFVSSLSTPVSRLAFMVFSRGTKSVSRPFAMGCISLPLLEELKMLNQSDPEF